MLGVLRHPTFRRLWLSQSISQVGDRLTTIVLALAVTELSGSTSTVGLVLAARYAPLILLSAVGGVWADRLPRRTVMLVADSCRGALHTLLAVLFLTGVVEVWHVLVIEALFSAAEAFSVPAYQGLVPQALPDDDALQPATALNVMARNGALLLGPSIGTAVFVAAGAGWAFAIDAATFVVALALLAGVHPRRRGEPVARTGMLRELGDGVREVTSRTWLWVTILVANLWLLVADGPFAVLGPTLGEQHYGDTAAFGVVISVFGAGLIAGSVLGGRLAPRRPLVAGYAGLVPVSLAYVAFGLGIPFGLALGCSFVGGVGAATFDVLWYTSLAQEVPPEALSRVTSLDWMGSMASLPITYLAAGTVAGALGAPEVVVAGGSISLLLVLGGLSTAAVRGFTVRGRAAASRSSAELPDPPVPAVPR